MAKTKGAPSVQNRHIYSRASYLFQAANYLARQHPKLSDASSKSDSDPRQHSAAPLNPDEQKATQNTARHILSDLRSVCLKVQIRQSPSLKRAVCKFCDTLQIEGQTCTSTVENASKGGRKPWADVLTIECRTCGHVKRYPVSAPRQKRRTLRDKEQLSMGTSPGNAVAGESMAAT